MVTACDLLARGLGLPALPMQPTECSGQHCAITGEPLVAGYRVAEVVPKAAGEWLDMLRGQVDGWLGEAAARLFYGTNTWNLGNRFVFEDGTAYWPLIARQAGRPVWSELARTVWAERRGQRCVGILTTDVKKRLWPLCRAGILGERTPVVIYDASQGLYGLYHIDWARMLEMLGMVEAIYEAGFSKRAIRVSLYAEMARREAGYQVVNAWERVLQKMRGHVEFDMATLIAQRGAKSDDGLS